MERVGGQIWFRSGHPPIGASATPSFGLIDTGILAAAMVRPTSGRVEAFTSDDCDEEQLCLYHPLDVSPPP